MEVYTHGGKGSLVPTAFSLFAGDVSIVNSFDVTVSYRIALLSTAPRRLIAEAWGMGFRFGAFVILGSAASSRDLPPSPTSSCATPCVCLAFTVPAWPRRHLPTSSIYAAVDRPIACVSRRRCGVNCTPRTPSCRLWIACVLKTDSDGMADVRGIPVGLLRELSEGPPCVYHRKCVWMSEGSVAHAAASPLAQCHHSSIPCSVP
ncbi:hypothetical protein R3P38DRAFT_3073367 [Favolaschia claudopus]|uniref:Uncharacterized protein n=1 Tax=Favolaschia claudopus TaxID=2862362 RepID=A0AAV9ZZ17_9AGAR